MRFANRLDKTKLPFHTIDFETLSMQDRYRLLCSAVQPRPSGCLPTCLPASLPPAELHELHELLLVWLLLHLDALRLLLLRLWQQRDAVRLHPAPVLDARGHTHPRQAPILRACISAVIAETCC